MVVPNPRRSFWSYLLREILEAFVFVVALLIAVGMIGSIFGLCDASENEQGGYDARIGDW